jgi:uncharacterized membrane protein (DUF2068 family)
MTHSRWLYAVRTTAIIEAVKGALVLTIGVGLASGLRHHAQRLLERWSAHLDPLAHLSHVLARLGSLLGRIDPPIALAVASLYACARFAEAYGLWHARAWALWLGAISGAIFVPFELLQLLRRPGLMSLAILIANITILAILARPLLAAAGVSDGDATHAAPRPGSS